MEYNSRLWSVVRRWSPFRWLNEWLDHQRKTTYGALDRFSLAIAILVVVVGIGIVTYAYYVSNEASNNSGQLRSLERAIAQNDFDLQIVALRNLVDKSPESTTYRYRLAIAEARNGDNEVAESLMLQLSDEGHPGAALWIAEHNFEPVDFNSWDESKCINFLRLLETASQGREVDCLIRSKKLLSAYLLEKGNVDEAVQHLADLTAIEPIASLHIASLYSAKKDQTAANIHANRARLYFERQLEKSPEDDVIRLNLARSLILQQRESDALTLLANGYELTGQSKLQQASGEVLVVWARRLENEDGSLLARVQLIHRATQCAPSDQAVIASVLWLIRECLNGNETIEKLQLAAASGADRESLHFILGLLALERGDLKDARLHFDLATLAGTHLPTVLNNLALNLFDAGYFERALAYADSATERLPDQPHLCETRGRILLRLGRFEESIAELTKGLAAEELRPIVFPNLAVAYRRVGNLAAAIEAESKLSQLQQ